MDEKEEKAQQARSWKDVERRKAQMMGKIVGIFNSCILPVGWAVEKIKTKQS